MNASYNTLTGFWRFLTWKLQSNKTVDACFWRLPYDLRRLVVRACGIDLGVSKSLMSEIIDHKLIFIRVPKTGSMSVEKSLFGRRIFGHQTIRQYELLFSRPLLSSFFTFAFVRNPWDRLVSAWTYLRENALGQSTMDPWGGSWFAKNLSRYTNFETFVLNWVTRSNAENGYTHFKPQVSFLRNSAGQIDLDFVGRFENFASDFEQVARLLGHTATLQTENRTRSRNSSSYREYYNEKTAEIAAKAYEADIQAFGYEF